MRRSAMLLGAGLLLATAPQAMAQGPQQPGRTPPASGEAAPAVPGQVPTATGGAIPGETSPSVRPPRPGPGGQQGAGPRDRPQEQPAGSARPGPDRDQRR